MICQYCGHKLTDGKCTYPACPGRLRPTGESSNGATLGQDSTLLRTAPVEVERLVDDLLSVSKQLGQSEARGMYDHIEPAEVAINDLKSRLLAALSNTTPYLSRDVSVPVNPDWEHCQRCGKRYDAVWRAPDKLWKAVTGIKDGSGLFCPSCFTAIAQGKGISVYWDACESEAWDKVAPVAQDDCIERIISYVDEYINDQIDRVVLKSEIGLVLNDIFFSYLVPADLVRELVE